MKTAYLDEIRQLDLFHSMQDENFEAVMRGAYVQSFPPLVDLIHEGDSSDFLHVIIDGSVELYATWSGKETTISIVRPVSTFILAAPAHLPLFAPVEHAHAQKRKRKETAEHQHMDGIALDQEMRKRPEPQRHQQRMARQTHDARPGGIKLPVVHAPEGKRIWAPERQRRNQERGQHQGEREMGESWNRVPEMHVRRTPGRANDPGQQQQGKCRVSQGEAARPKCCNTC